MSPANTYRVVQKLHSGTISVCNQPPRSTQPSTLSGTVNEYQTKGGDALRLGSEGRHGVRRFA